MKRIILLVLALLCAPPAFALEPISSAPAPLELTESEQARVDKGKTAQRYVRGEDEGWGIAVNLVEAPADVVWDTILNYDRYPDWVNNVTSCTVYETRGDDLYVDMQMSILGIKKALYTVNTVRRDDGWMAWTLDERHESAVEEMIGYWRVEQIQADPPVTRLDYLTQMKARGVPEWLVKILTKESLKDGTRWVKERAEEAYSG